jgi:hypothetical protein
VYVLDFLGLPNKHPQNLCAFASLREKKHAASKAEEMIAPEVCDATEVERKDKSRQTKKIPQT